MKKAAEQPFKVRCMKEAGNESLIENKNWPGSTIDRLWLFLYFPEFFLQTLTNKLDQTNAYVLVNLARSDPKIQQLNWKARELGLYQGMPLSLVNLADNVRFFERDKDIEKRVINRLLSWANRFTPIVINKLPDGLLMEIRGSLGLFGGGDRFLEKVLSSFHMLGYKFNYSVSPTPLAAEVVAKAGTEKNITDKNCLNKILRKVSINHLSLSSKQLSALRKMGIKTLGDCRRLPREGLIDRFGMDFVKKFDCLYGSTLDLQVASDILERFSASIELDYEIDSWAELKNYVVKLLEKMKRYLISKVVKASELLWVFYGEGCKEDITIRLSNPSTDISMMLRILEVKIENKKFQGFITSIRLSISEVKSNRADNLNILKEMKGDSDESYGEFISRTRSCYGERSLYNLTQRAEHIPEDSFAYFYSVEKKMTEALLCQKTMKAKKRPIWLINPPKKLTVIKNRPFYNGCLSLISERERIVNGWWKGKEIARDYFMAESESKMLLWVYRELNNGKDWYLQGIFE